jgi:Holliday junction DNA helicase RuvA
MRGKQGADNRATPQSAPDNHTDNQNALLALGYSEKESLSALKTLPEGVGVSDGIKQALKALVR